MEKRAKKLRVGDRVRVIGQALPTGRLVQISETEPAVARAIMEYPSGIVVPRVERLEHFEAAPSDEMQLELLP